MPAGHLTWNSKILFCPLKHKSYPHLFFIIAFFQKIQQIELARKNLLKNEFEKWRFLTPELVNFLIKKFC